MTAAIKIEKGVPVPSARFCYPFSNMDVGDSFEAPMSKRGSLSASASAFAKRHGVKFAIRAVDGALRVWRVS